MRRAPLTLVGCAAALAAAAALVHGCSLGIDPSDIREASGAEGTLSSTSTMCAQACGDRCDVADSCGGTCACTSDQTCVSTTCESCGPWAQIPAGVTVGGRVVRGETAIFAAGYTDDASGPNHWVGAFDACAGDATRHVIGPASVAQLGTIADGGDRLFVASNDAEGGPRLTVLDPAGAVLGHQMLPRNDVTDVVTDLAVGADQQVWGVGTTAGEGWIFRASRDGDGACSSYVLDRPGSFGVVVRSNGSAVVGALDTSEQLSLHAFLGTCAAKPPCSTCDQAQSETRTDIGVSPHPTQMVIEQGHLFVVGYRGDAKTEGFVIRFDAGSLQADGPTYTFATNGDNNALLAVSSSGGHVYAAGATGLASPTSTSTGRAMVLDLTLDLDLVAQLDVPQVNVVTGVTAHDGRLVVAGSKGGAVVVKASDGAGSWQ